MSRRLTQSPPRRRCGILISTILISTAIASIIVSSSAVAVETLADFESGTLDGWVKGGVNGGFAFPVAEGTCFSANDTTGISLPGNFSAAIRPDAAGSKRSLGTLTSMPFTAGDGIAFMALAETRDGKSGTRSVDFSVSVLNETGVEQFTVPFTTSVVRLHPGCPSEVRNGSFSAHFVDTRRFVDQTIRLQFRVQTNKSGEGNFVLVDNVVKFDRGEMPLFASAPVARAGTSFTSAGTLRVDAGLSFDPDDQPLTYEWFIDDTTANPRTGKRVCVNDLDPGQHTVTLFVSDGLHAVSDTMLLAIPESVTHNQDMLTNDTDNANTDRTLFDPGCFEQEQKNGVPPPAGNDDGDSNGDGNDNSDGTGDSSGATSAAN